MIKTTAVVYNKFLTDPDYWPVDAYMDDVEIYVDGILSEDGVDTEKLPPDSKIEIGVGYITNPDGDALGSLQSFFKKWLRLQTNSIIMVECENSQIEEIKDLLKSKGCKIIK